MDLRLVGIATRDWWNLCTMSSATCIVWVKHDALSDWFMSRSLLAVLSWLESHCGFYPGAEPGFSNRGGAKDYCARSAHSAAKRGVLFGRGPAALGVSHGRGGSRNLRKGGGITYWVFFGGGTPTLFFSERHLRRGGGGGVSSNRGIAGRNQTLFFFFFFFFKVSKGGGAHVPKGGGIYRKNVSKRGGHGPAVPPPPLNPPLSHGIWALFWRILIPKKIDLKNLVDQN